MKIWKFSASGLLRGAVAAAFAGAVVLGLGLPAQATLTGDPFTLTSQQAVAPCNPSCMDNDTVGAGAEFFAGDGSNIGTFFTNFGPTSTIDVGASSITFFFDFGHAPTYTFTNLNWTDDPSGVIVSVSSTLLFGTLPGMNNPAVSSTADSVTVQLDCGVFNTGTFCGAPGGTSFRVDIVTDHDNGGDPVPEPSSIMLFGAGLGMLGLMVMTRRRRQAA